MTPNTHLGIDPELCGRPESLAEGAARVRLHTGSRMAADDHGLVHGGFVFGLADYAAMLAVNDPNVVLGSAETRFTAPVRAGDVLVADATVTGSDRRRRVVEVVVTCGDDTVLTGTFTCFVLDAHVLEAR